MKSRSIEMTTPGVPAGAVAPSRRMLLMAAFVILCLSWGSTWLLGKRALAYTPPLMFVGWRSFIGGLILLVASGCVEPPRFALLWPGAFLMTAVNFGLMAWGMLSVPSGLAATVNLATVPLAVLLFSGRIPALPQWLGLVAGSGGLAMLYVHASSAPQPELSWGVLAIVAGAACYGAGTVLMKSRSAESGVLQLAAWHSLIGGALLLLCSAATEPWTRDVWAAVTRPWALVNFMLIVLLSTLIGLSVYLYLLRHWSAGAVASYAYFCPLVALTLGHVFAQELLEPRELLACATLIFAAVATNASQRGEDEKDASPAASGMIR